MLKFIILLLGFGIAQYVDMITYDNPGNYLLEPSDYNYADSFIVEMWSAGASGSAYAVTCSQMPTQNNKYITGGGGGSYIKAKITTNQQNFNLTVGRGGTTQYVPGYSVFSPCNIINTNGGNTSFIGDNINLSLIGGYTNGTGGYVSSQIVTGHDSIYAALNGANGSPFYNTVGCYNQWCGNDCYCNLGLYYGGNGGNAACGGNGGTYLDKHYAQSTSNVNGTFPGGGGCSYVEPCQYYNGVCSCNGINCWNSNRVGNGSNGAIVLYIPRANTMSASVSTSVSPSLSASVSPSLSASVSASLSASVSPSLSASASATVSASVNTSASTLLSASESATVSASMNVSATASESLLQSVSTSAHQTMSESVDQTMSTSVPTSISTSLSESITIRNKEYAYIIIIFGCVMICTIILFMIIYLSYKMKNTNQNESRIIELGVIDQY